MTTSRGAHDVQKLSGECFTCHPGTGCAGKCYFPCACICCLCTHRAHCVRTGELAIAEKFNEYTRTLEPGQHFLIDICGCYEEKLVARMSMRLQSIRLRNERYKTRDHVFVDLNGYILYSIIMEQVADAHYKLEDPNQQIRQYVDDALRSEVAKHPVDQLFHLRDAVNLAVQRNVSHLIAQYGYVIDKIAITRLAPDRAVMASMNNIVAQKRLKEAEAHRAAAIKIFEVKRAEGDAEASYLSGIGTSKQRAAIQEGFDEMVGEFSEYTGLEEETVRSIIYTTQYFDSQEGMIAGKRGHPSRILLGHSPSALIHHTSQLHETLGTDYVRFANFPSADQQVMLRDKWTAVMEEKNRLKQEEFERQLRDKPGAMSPAPVETNPLLPPDGEDPVLTSTSI